MRRPDIPAKFHPVIVWNYLYGAVGFVDNVEQRSPQQEEQDEQRYEISSWSKKTVYKIIPIFLAIYDVSFQSLEIYFLKMAGHEKVTSRHHCYLPPNAQPKLNIC